MFDIFINNDVLVDYIFLDCRTIQRCFLLSLSLLGYRTLCRYQLESLYKQLLVQYDLCRVAHICFSLQHALMVWINMSLFPFVSPRSTLQGQCSCLGDSGPSRSATSIPTRAERRWAERSSCPSVSCSPTKCLVSSSGGAAALSPSDRRRAAATAKGQFPPRAAEQPPPAVASSSCWALAASALWLARARGPAGWKWANTTTQTCEPQYGRLTLQSVIRLPDQHRGGFDTDGTVKEQRHRWHPERSDWGGEKEGRNGQESGARKDWQPVWGCSRGNSKIIYSPSANGKNTHWLKRPMRSRCPSLIVFKSFYCGKCRIHNFWTHTKNLKVKII